MVSQSYRRFQRTYYNDRVAFVHDCIRWPEGEGPTEYQVEALGLFDGGERRVCIRSPHSAGKTALAAWLTLHFSLTRDGGDWKVPTLASSWRQLTKYLWPEVHRWARSLNWSVIHRAPFTERELMVRSLRLGTGEAFALTATDAMLIEGAHAPQLLYVFDESKAISVPLWDAAEGAFATLGGAYWLAISTPGEPQGRFYDIQSRKPGYDDWTVMHVTLEDGIRAGRIDPKWAEKRREQWGEGSPVYKNRVLGEFAESSVDTVIPLSWVEAAVERWYEWDKRGWELSLGVDVGGGTERGDQSVIAVVYDRFKVKSLDKVPVATDPSVSTMELVGRIMSYGKVKHCVIDAIGIGLGVLHRLREQQREATAFVASADTTLRDKTGEVGFINWRAAAWWIMRELLEPNSGYDVCLPPDDELIGELTAPTWAYTSSAKIKVEAKESLKSTLGRSTNCADAVIQAIVGPTLENARRLEAAKKAVKPEVKSVWAPGYRIGQGLVRSRW